MPVPEKNQDLRMTLSEQGNSSLGKRSSFQNKRGNFLIQADMCGILGIRNPKKNPA
jgi:hypothetical protein